MTTTADTSGAPAEAAAPDPTFTLGEVVVYEWTDPYHADPQVLYGLVVELPVDGDPAAVPPVVPVAGYGVAWLPPGIARIVAADLKAV